MSDYQRIRTPFLGMSFTPDVPSNALGTNEYNSGQNVETDVRGIKKIFGEQEILSAIPNEPIFMEGGYRTEAQWVYIVATRDSSSQGRWYMLTSSGITNITPGVGGNPSVFLAGYTADLNITVSVVGGIFFINDTLNNPMYFLPTANEITVSSSAGWNYEPGVTSTTAGFVRNFCSPNVGNILIAGNITKVIGGIVNNYPTTVRWSQAFGLTGYPETWEPTLSNVANEQEVPVRGPLIDGFVFGSIPNLQVIAVRQHLVAVTSRSQVRVVNLNLVLLGVVHHKDAVRVSCTQITVEVILDLLVAQGLKVCTIKHPDVSSIYTVDA